MSINESWEEKLQRLQISADRIFEASVLVASILRRGYAMIYKCNFAFLIDSQGGPRKNFEIIKAFAVNDAAEEDLLSNGQMSKEFTGQLGSRRSGILLCAP